MVAILTTSAHTGYRTAELQRLATALALDETKLKEGENICPSHISTKQKPSNITILTNCKLYSNYSFHSVMYTRNNDFILLHP